jgi:hypothetical protein
MTACSGSTRATAWPYSADRVVALLPRSLDLPELAVVDDRFQVTPLLPLLAGDGHFFVLALSQNQIRLLEGTRDRVEEVDLPGVPLGVRDALQGEEVQSSCSCMSPTAAESAQEASTTATGIQARGKRSGSCATSGRWIEGFVRCWPASAPR